MQSQIGNPRFSLLAATPGQRALVVLHFAQEQVLRWCVTDVIGWNVVEQARGEGSLPLLVPYPLVAIGWQNESLRAVYPIHFNGTVSNNQGGDWPTVKDAMTVLTNRCNPQTTFLPPFPWNPGEEYVAI